MQSKSQARDVPSPPRSDRCLLVFLCVFGERGGGVGRPTGQVMNHVVLAGQGATAGSAEELPRRQEICDNGPNVQLSLVGMELPDPDSGGVRWQRAFAHV